MGDHAKEVSPFLKIKSCLKRNGLRSLQLEKKSPNRKSDNKEWLPRKDKPKFREFIKMSELK